jgi:hypothetical protein
VDTRFERLLSNCLRALESPCLLTHGAHGRRFESAVSAEQMIVRVQVERGGKKKSVSATRCEAED